MSEYLLTALSRAPKVVERLLRVFPNERLDDRVEKDRFTSREVVAHLADLEGVVLDRIRLANLKPGATADKYDPDERSGSHKFSEKEVFHEAEVYESRRQMTVDYLRELKPADWGKTFVHPSMGALTIEQYVGCVLAHDLLHLEQLSNYLATEAATIL